MKSFAQGHDLIAIGASAGGIDPLRHLLGALPPDFSAAILVVVHVGASSALAQILNLAGPLDAKEAQDGEEVKNGRVYVAAPGRHLLLHDNHLLLRRGPKENLARPAVDPLFRSVAASVGGRAIGVILSGALNDGTAGLHAIKRCGGLAVLQDPSEAVVPDMPASALRHVEVDYSVRAAEMPALLERLIQMPAGNTPEIPLDIRLEAAVAAQELAGMDLEDSLGTRSPFTCPECHGALWEVEDGSLLRYRCHVGHSFTAETVLSARNEEVESLLSNLLRSHEERAALTKRMAKQARTRDQHALAHQLAVRAREYEDDAALVRRLMRNADRFRAAVEPNEGGAPPDEQE